MTFAVRLEKLRFLAAEMQLAHRLAQFAPTDADARMLARHVIIRAKDYIEHARRLRGPLRDAGIDTKAYHKLKEYVAKEFESYFQIIRDKLSAHVQDLEFLERIKQWNSVDSSKAGFFADAGVEIYRLLEGLGIPGCIPLTEFSELSDPAFRHALIDYRGSGNKVVSLEIGSDALSMTRPNSSTIINMTPVHARASQLALLHRWIEAQKRLLARFAVYPDVIRILKARIVTDIISACDCLVTRPVASGAPQEMNGLDVLLTTSQALQNPIDQFRAIYNLEQVTAQLRAVRNKVGGHLDEDPNVSLATLLQILDQTDFEGVFKIYGTLRGVFEQAARQVSFLTGYLADGRTLYGVVGGQSGTSVTPFDDKPTLGRTTAVHEPIPESYEALAAKLEEYLTGDPEVRLRARSMFWQAFLHSPVEEIVHIEERAGSATRYYHQSFRSSHRFLLQALRRETDSERTVGILELARECASGDPRTLAEVLLRYSDSPQSAPYLAAVAYCLDDLAEWRNERARKFLEAGLPSIPPLGVQSRIGLLRMFVRSEGVMLINRGQAVDKFADVLAQLTSGYDAPHRLLTEIYLASQFCDPRIVIFEKPFAQDYASVRAEIIRLAGDLVPASDMWRVRGFVQRLADSWDYPGVCAFLFDELKGGNYEPLGRMLVEYTCAGAILAANHDQSRRHLCGCLMRLGRYNEALQLAEGLAAANPINMDLQVLHAQALACVERRRTEAVQRIAEIDVLYTLNTNQRRIIDGLKSAIAASASETE